MEGIVKHVLHADTQITNINQTLTHFALPSGD